MQRGKQAKCEERAAPGDLAALFADLGCLAQDVPLEDVVGGIGADDAAKVAECGGLS